MFVCGQWMGGEGEVINSADKSECVLIECAPGTPPPKKPHNVTSRILYHSQICSWSYVSNHCPGVRILMTSDVNTHSLQQLCMQKIMQEPLINCEHILTFMVDM
jgi:hypothetical protein